MTAYDIQARRDAWEDLRPIADGGSGQAFTITHTEPGTYDTATGVNTLPSPTTQTGCGIVEAYKAHQIDGTLILAGDRRVMLAALTPSGAVLTDPAVDDTIQIDRACTIKAVEPFAPAGLAIFYYLQIRG